jgi:hypothetical protein
MRLLCCLLLCLSAFSVMATTATKADGVASAAKATARVDMIAFVDEVRIEPSAGRDITLDQRERFQFNAPKGGGRWELRATFSDRERLFHINGELRFNGKRVQTLDLRIRDTGTIDATSVDPTSRLKIMLILRRND